MVQGYSGPSVPRYVEYITESHNTIESEWTWDTYQQYGLHPYRTLPVARETKAYAP